MAEGQRFELWVPCGTAVFKTAAINHSAIPPDAWYEEYREVRFFVKIFFRETLKNFEFHCQKNLFLSHLRISKLLSKKFFFLELLVFARFQFFYFSKFLYTSHLRS